MNPDSATTAGFSPAPPPPPPPPPAPGQTPALRISTAEAPRPVRRPQNNSSDPYEPPAAIQNAMMTKDKKPFTYTPGMGGKLDLSQIRSPRMARRVAKNANDEGIEGPPKSALESKPALLTTAGANLYVQPQVAVPVFPTNIPPQSNVNRTPSAHVNRAPSNAWSSQPEAPRRTEVKVTPAVVVPSSPQSPTPPQVTLAKAPTPWLQNKPKAQEELPEWAKRANAARPTEFDIEGPASPPPIQHQPQQFYVQPNSPAVQPQAVQRQSSIQKVVSSQPGQQDRVIPVRIEDRPSVFSVKNEPGHHQLKQSPNQQQRWGQTQPQSQVQVQVQQQPQQSGGTRIIPIMVEDDNQPQVRTIPVEIQGPKVVIQRGPPGPQSPVEPGPVQSRSFRVLQKITDTDSDTDVDGNSEQIRKLQLTEDDKTLMNKFKEQVDSETYLHQEEDPRYRGAAIPSRAFRFLQNMTDSGEVVPSTSNAGPRPASAITKKQNRNSQSFEEAQANLPPSEQQVREPKKYMGSAIPSRSFRILQAMTSPENIAPQENRQQDFTSRTENSVTGNQQSGLFFPNCPSPYWNPEGGWWGYYPVQYATPPPQNTLQNPPPGMNLAYNPYAYSGYAADGNPYAYYHPMYDQNYAQSYAQSYETQSQNQAQAQPQSHQPLQTLGEGEGEGEGEREGEREGEGQPADRLSLSQTQNQYLVHGYAPLPFYNTDSNYIHQNYALDATSNNDNINETKINGISPKENAISQPAKKELDYLTVPKWNNKNRQISLNGETNKNLEPINVLDIKGNVDALRKRFSEIDANSNVDATKKKFSDIDTNINIDALKERFSGKKDTSDCTIDSKTDTDLKFDSESDDSDSDSDSSDSDSSDDSSDSSSSSSDSESESEYVAYTSQTKIEEAVPRLEESVKSTSDKDCLQSLSATTISEDGLEHSSRLSSDKLSGSDCDSDADDEYQIESLNNDCILPHQLSVIYEDAEHTETESESRKLDCVKEAVDTEAELFREIGDPPDDDDGDDTTVSVSLPLRFKFSVSENDEDVTTVIVGDSTVKTGSKFESESRTSKSSTDPATDDNDVHVNFRIKKTDDTSVDFTLKRQKESNGSFDTEFTLATEEEEAQVHLKETIEENIDVDANLAALLEDNNAESMGGRNIRGAKRVDCNENIETEFTIRRKKTDVTRHVWRKDLDLETEKDLETLVKSEEPKEDTETEYTVRNLAKEKTLAVHEAEYEVTNSTSAIEENTHKELIERKSLKVAERESVRTEFAVRKISKSESEEKPMVEEEVEESEEKTQSMDCNFVQVNGNGTKRLLSVQNSKDETDDEDSGVTSDMSRIISEVDTDSECASIRRMNKYRRTQTHSRLFKLLNDDTVLEEEVDSSEECYSPARREHLSLPLKGTVFNYDENYYSNYSSGITSPDYSPLCEQSWRRIHDGRCIESDNSSAVTTPNDYVDLGDALHYGVFQPTEKIAPTDDPYFQTWKKVASPIELDYDILPSVAFKKLKKLENGGAGLYSKFARVNVLCPRIKSSKNVPQTLQSRCKSTPSSIPFLATISSLKNGHC